MRGAAPSSVAMAVLWVEGWALVVSRPFVSGATPRLWELLWLLPIATPFLALAVSLVTALHVLPSLALGHWLGKRWGDGKRWWWVAAGVAVGLVPATGLPMLAWYGLGDGPFSQADAVGWPASAGVLFGSALPAALAAHATVLREEAGRPVRPVARIIAWGALAVSTTFVIALAVATASG
ncbi:hypothetical protein [Streptomyces hypolithicus]